MTNYKLVDWAVRCWHEQVANRPLINVHRRTLDGVWRQVINFAGEDDVVLLGPRHDDMLDASGNPLPAEHQPAPDELSDYDRGFIDGKLDRIIDEVVAESELVEALEQANQLLYQAVNIHHLSTEMRERVVNTRAEVSTLLAAHRKQGGE